MDKNLLSRALFILSVSSIVSFSSIKTNQEIKKENVKKILFENQVNFLKKDMGLTKEDSLLLARTINPILENKEVSLHAKQFIEYVDNYRKGTFTLKACEPAFDRFYASFLKEISKSKIDSLYSVLNKYTFFKNFEKERKLSELVFRKKFRDYFFKKYVEKKKAPVLKKRYDVRTPKSVLVKSSSEKKVFRKRFSRKA